MSTLGLITCRYCGIVNDTDRHECLLCGTNLLRPVDFFDKAENLRYFTRGGLLDIAAAVFRGDIIEDEADVEHTAMTETALKLGLEASWASIDLVFYRKNPVLGVPTMGVRWPSNPLFSGIEMSFLEDGRETLYVSMERPGPEKRGSNFRWDSEFADPRYEYQLVLYGTVRRGRKPPRIIKSEAVSLRPDASGAPDAPYSLVRPLSGIRVK
jgi:hypothetical protein